MLSLDELFAFDRVDGDPFPRFADAFVFDNPIGSGKNRIVATSSGIMPRIDTGAPLPVDNRTSPGKLAIRAFGA